MIRASFWASNPFLVKSEPRFGLQIDFWSNPSLVLGSKSIFGVIPAGFWASASTRAPTRGITWAITQGAHKGRPYEGTQETKNEKQINGA